MKKTRLLEIVREEISSALNEYGFSSQSSLEEDQLNEIEQLAEMASMVQLKTQLEKQGKNAELSAVKAAEKATIDKLKQNPVFSGEGKNARLKGYVSALKKELKAEHDINLQDLLTKVMLDAEKAGDKFKDDIATNTIEKDAAAQILGTEKGQRGRKASEEKKEASKKEKPESTGKKGRPAGTTKEKVATRTPGDDGFDDVSYSDVEDEDTFDSEKAPAGDVEMEKAARGKDELVKQYKSEVEPELKDKIAKAKEGDKDAMAWLKSKQDIIKKYNQAKQVNI